MGIFASEFCDRVSRLGLQLVLDAIARRLRCERYAAAGNGKRNASRHGITAGVQMVGGSEM